MSFDSPRRSRLAALICVVTGLYWLAAFAATHLPVVPTPVVLGHGGIDKIAHLSVFAGLAVLLCATGTSLGCSPRMLFVAVFAIAAVYAAFDEFTQRFVAHRVPDVRDWVADMLGTGVGITVFVVVRETWLAFHRRLTVT